MKKIDLHIHTVKTAHDNDFEFSLDAFKQYVTDAKIDVVAVTNHNVFDASQFRLIQQEIPAQVFPGIEIDLPSGHLLLISDGRDMASFDRASGVGPRQPIDNASDFVESRSFFALKMRFFMVKKAL